MYRLLKHQGKIYILDPISDSWFGRILAKIAPLFERSAVKSYSTGKTGTSDNLVPVKNDHDTRSNAKCKMQGVILCTQVIPHRRFVHIFVILKNSLALRQKFFNFPDRFLNIKQPCINFSIHKLIFLIHLKHRGKMDS